MSRTTTPPATPTAGAAPAHGGLTDALAAVPWEELVTSALLGTDRRPPEGASGTGPDGGPHRHHPRAGRAGGRRGAR
ncbi:hypothetical protein AB0D00_30005, partial [Streptomyces sp. NPDC048213]